MIGDPRLARHISNAVVKATPQGDVITKPDPHSPAKIDAAIAAVVAVSMQIPKKKFVPYVGDTG